MRIMYVAPMPGAGGAILFVAALLIGKGMYEDHQRGEPMPQQELEGLKSACLRNFYWAVPEMSEDRNGKSFVRSFKCKDAQRNDVEPDPDKLCDRDGYVEATFEFPARPGRSKPKLPFIGCWPEASLKDGKGHATTGEDIVAGVKDGLWDPDNLRSKARHW